MAHSIELLKPKDKSFLRKLSNSKWAFKNCLCPALLHFLCYSRGSNYHSEQQTGFCDRTSSLLVLHEYMKGQHSAISKRPGRFCKLQLSHRAKVQLEGVMISATLPWALCQGRLQTVTRPELGARWEPAAGVRDWLQQPSLHRGAPTQITSCFSVLLQTHATTTMAGRAENES